MSLGWNSAPEQFTTKVTTEVMLKREDDKAQREALITLVGAKTDF